MNEFLWHIPESWQWVSLAEVSETTSGGTPKRDRPEFYGGSIPWLKSGELNDALITETEEFITNEGLKSSSAKLFPAGTVCIALYGATVGKLGILRIAATTNQAICGIFVPEEVEPKYIFRFLEFQRPNLIAAGQGGAQPNISQAIVRTISLPLAPSREQSRIVEQIEALLSDLEAAVKALKRVQANLKRYRASVLKAACEGRLVPTEAELARKEGRPCETGEKLLARILKERRAKWEADQLAKMLAAGKPPTNDYWKAKYADPAPPETTDLPALPEGWTWARAEQLCGFITKGTTPAAHRLFARAGDVPFVKVYNLSTDGTLDFNTEPTFVGRETHNGELARSRVIPGDILMNIVGPPLGKVSIVPDSYSEWNVNQAIAIFRPIDGLCRRYLSSLLLSEDILRWAVTRAKATAGQFNLTLEICRDLPLPLPPEAEQMRIADEADARLTSLQFTSRSLRHALARSDRLRQAILKRAFEGKLVPQDPNDEPASGLLEGIRAERAQQNSTKPRPPRFRRKVETASA